MPTVAQNTFSLDKLEPLFSGDERLMSAQFIADMVAAKGTLMAIVTASNASEVQTLTITGTPTGGTFRLSYNGQVTAPIAYNANAAAVQAALQALTTIGSGGATCGGGALPGTPVTITFAGALANQPHNLIVVTDQLFTGGSSPAATIARTTTGVANGKYIPFDDTIIADPTTAPTVAGNGAGSAFGAGTYGVQYTLVTGAGESKPSPATFVVVTANQNLRVSAIASLDSSVTAVNYYVNGCWAAQTVPSSGTAAQTDITGSALATGRTAPEVSSSYKYSDGRQTAVGILAYSVATDSQGRITLGTSASGGWFGETLLSEAIYYKGSFDTSKLVCTGGAAGVTNKAKADLAGRLLYGTNANGAFLMD